MGDNALRASRVGGDGASDGDAEASRVPLLEEQAALIRHLVAALCPRDAGLQADDIEQEVRLRVWHALQDERKIRDPASYVWRVASTATLDAIRRAKVRREVPFDALGEHPALTAEIGAGRSPEGTAGRRRVLERVEQVLSSMRLDHQRAVRLHLEGFTTQEIGDLSSWTEAKARNLLYRALRELRDCLRRHGIEYEVDE